MIGDTNQMPRSVAAFSKSRAISGSIARGGSLFKFFFWLMCL